MVYPHEEPLSEEQTEYLKKVYYSGAFFGRDRLFSLIRDFKPHIYREQMWKWLQSQKTQQITQQVKKQKDIRPIRATKSSTLQVDLLDMSSRPDRGNKFILNVIDLYSRFVWSYPLKNKTPAKIKEHVQSIISEYPSLKIITCDNGLEFVKLDTIPNVKVIRGLPSVPTSQASIESFHKT
jgi:hypothetical protein